METNPEDEKLVKELAAIPMHSTQSVYENVMAQRVPGGWNYIYYNETGSVSAVVFVAMPKTFMCEF